MRKYTKQDLRIITAGEHVREYVEMYFGPEGPSAGRIASALVDTARLAGAARADSIRSGDWTLIRSDIDWLQGHRDRPSDEACTWERPAYFVELGANAVWGEVMVPIFADSAITWTPTTQDPITGAAEVLEQAIAQNPLPTWCERAVAFRYVG